MKKFILIPDSFKGTMTSIEVCSAMERAIRRNRPDAETRAIPVADGGEGSVDAFISAHGGRKICKTVSGPWQEEVEGFWGLLPDGTAVVEMAAAASLSLAGDRKDPSLTTTLGVGELMLDALDHDAKKLIIGLGGSCTNDAATGLLHALGMRFLDKDGKAFLPVGATLKDIAKIDDSHLDERLKDIGIVTMCDIDNPFSGPEGAAFIYGPQKGADSDMVKMLDIGLKSFRNVIFEHSGIDVDEVPGAGAAGGMGGALHALLHSPLKKGIDTVLDTAGFDELLEDADYVFTGEGKLDSQSLRGKVVMGVAERAKRKNVKVLAFVGDIGDSIEEAYDRGVTGVFSINRVAVPYAEARKRALSDLELTVDNVLRFEKSILD